MTAACTTPLLAKPNETLEAHSLAVLRLGEALCQHLALMGEVRTRALLACAFHDIGKATHSFQRYIRGQQRKAYPHALASFPVVLAAEKEAVNLPPVASLAVLSHHSPLRPTLYALYTATPEYCLALPQVYNVLKEALKRAGVQELPDAVEALLTVHPAQLVRFFLQQEGTAQVRAIDIADFAHVKAVLHLADWAASAEWTLGHVSRLFLRNGPLCVERYMAYRGLSPHAFQHKLKQQQAQPRILLRAPTGSGKTEGVLRWTGKVPRILYFLPTQATVNAMYHRLQRVFGREAVGLSHGRAVYMLKKQALEEQEEAPLDVHLWDSVFARPVTVATLDQYLLAHLHGRHWEERFTLSRQAAVVLDELHAYEPYTLGLLQRVLERYPPRKLAVLSATLPDVLVHRLFPEERPLLIEAETELWHQTRHRITCKATRIAEQLPEVLRRARSGDSVLVVVNTVRDAVAYYRMLKESHSDVHLLHSRFVYRDRTRKEQQVEQVVPGRILVATQVVEVSLDISYNVLFTELAPIDALVQRFGRVNRYGTEVPSGINGYICLKPGEYSQRIYGKNYLEYSRELLLRLPERPDHAFWRVLTETYYQRIMQEPEYEADWQEGRRNVDEMLDLLGIYTVNLADEEMAQRFLSRKSTMPVNVLPAPFEEEALAWKQTRQGWRLPEVLVPIRVNWLTIAPDHFQFSQELGVFLTTLPYNSDTGLHLAPYEDQTQTYDIW